MFHASDMIKDVSLRLLHLILLGLLDWLKIRYSRRSDTSAISLAVDRPRSQAQADFWNPTGRVGAENRVTHPD
jgi:hypothetical protein